MGLFAIIMRKIWITRELTVTQCMLSIKLCCNSVNYRGSQCINATNAKQYYIKLDMHQIEMDSFLAPAPSLHLLSANLFSTFCLTRVKI